MAGAGAGSGSGGGVPPSQNPFMQGLLESKAQPQGGAVDRTFAEQLQQTVQPLHATEREDLARVQAIIDDTIGTLDTNGLITWQRRLRGAPTAELEQAVTEMLARVNPRTQERLVRLIGQTPREFIESSMRSSVNDRLQALRQIAAERKRQPALQPPPEAKAAEVKTSLRRRPPDPAFQAPVQMDLSTDEARAELKGSRDDGKEAKRAQQTPEQKAVLQNLRAQWRSPYSTPLAGIEPPATYGPSGPRKRRHYSPIEDFEQYARVRDRNVRMRLDERGASASLPQSAFDYRRNQQIPAALRDTESAGDQIQSIESEFRNIGREIATIAQTSLIPIRAEMQRLREILDAHDEERQQAAAGQFGAVGLPLGEAKRIAAEMKLLDGLERRLAPLVPPPDRFYDAQGNLTGERVDTRPHFDERGNRVPIGTSYHDYRDERYQKLRLQLSPGDEKLRNEIFERIGLQFPEGKQFRERKYELQSQRPTLPPGRPPAVARIREIDRLLLRAKQLQLQYNWARSRSGVPFEYRGLAADDFEHPDFKEDFKRFREAAQEYQDFKLQQEFKNLELGPEPVGGAGAGSAAAAQPQDDRLERWIQFAQDEELGDEFEYTARELRAREVGDTMFELNERFGEVNSDLQYERDHNGDPAEIKRLTEEKNAIRAQYDAADSERKRLSTNLDAKVREFQNTQAQRIREIATAQRSPSSYYQQERGYGWGWISSWFGRTWDAKTMDYTAGEPPIFAELQRFDDAIDDLQRSGAATPLEAVRRKQWARMVVNTQIQNHFGQTTLHEWFERPQVMAQNRDVHRYDFPLVNNFVGALDNAKRLRFQNTLREVQAQARQFQQLGDQIEGAGDGPQREFAAAMQATGNTQLSGNRNLMSILFGTQTQPGYASSRDSLSLRLDDRVTAYRPYSHTPQLLQPLPLLAQRGPPPAIPTAAARPAGYQTPPPSPEELPLSERFAAGWPQSPEELMLSQRFAGAPRVPPPILLPPAPKMPGPQQLQRRMALERRRYNDSSSDEDVRVVAAVGAGAGSAAPAAPAAPAAAPVAPVVVAPAPAAAGGMPADYGIAGAGYTQAQLQQLWALEGVEGGGAAQTALMDQWTVEAMDAAGGWDEGDDE
jgi:hypothetical protein